MTNRKFAETVEAFPLRGDSPRCGEMAEGQKGRKAFALPKLHMQKISYD